MLISNISLKKRGGEEQKYKAGEISDPAFVEPMHQLCAAAALAIHSELPRCSSELSDESFLFLCSVLDNGSPMWTWKHTGQGLRITLPQPFKQGISCYFTKYSPRSSKRSEYRQRCVVLLAALMQGRRGSIMNLTVWNADFLLRRVILRPAFGLAWGVAPWNWTTLISLRIESVMTRPCHSFKGGMSASSIHCYVLPAAQHKTELCKSSWTIQLSLPFPSTPFFTLSSNSVIMKYLMSLFHTALNFPALWDAVQETSLISNGCGCQINPP